MTYPEAIQFLYGLRWFGAKFGLTNTFKLAALAGNPQNQLRFIHVAGTNGKGSTCAMLESIYRAAGLRVGLFTSPHLVAFGERIQVNRRVISEGDIARLVAEMRSLLEVGWGTPDCIEPSRTHPDPSKGSRSHEGPSPALAGTLSPSEGERERERGPTSIPRSTTVRPCGSGVFSPSAAHESEPRGPEDSHSAATEHPTFFEVVTVMALRYFAAQECDLVIWETGLGGRLDSTNIVTPLASVITNIQYDHQKWLGETLASIAAEKAGIIKPGIPVLTATDAAEALQVIAETARRQAAPLTTLSPAELDRPPLSTIQLPLPGQHQRMNAAVAIATVRALTSQIPVGEDTICAGLSRVHWAGRLQLVTRLTGQKVLLDGAHNVGGAGILATAMKEYFPSAAPTLVLGILRDKDWPAMCEILAPLAARILLVPVPSERSATPQELAEACRRANPGAQVIECASLGEALEATTNDGFVTIGGSLYLIGEAMELLHLSPAKANSERHLNEWAVRTDTNGP
jgi:dihydrofolate synthase/folylpolyglutamate synthase